MSRHVLLIIVSLLLAHQACLDQLEASYLAPASGSSVFANNNNDSSSSPVAGQQPGLKRYPALELQGRRQPGAPSPATRLLLTTTGHSIKLHPLNEDELTPSGGHYVIKTSAPDLSDPQVLESFGANPRYLKWLKHQQQQRTLGETGQLDKRQRHVSILPRSSSGSSTEVDEPADELYHTSEWKRPFITSVGFFFHPAFCLSSPMAAACLVIHWLDPQNNALHVGSLLLDGQQQIHLLATQFEPQASSRARAPNSLRLHQFAPIDLCAEAGLEGGQCRSLDATIEAKTGRLYASITNTSGRTFSLLWASVEANVTATTRRLTLSHKRQAVEANEQAASELAQATGWRLRDRLLAGHWGAHLLMLNKHAGRLEAMPLTASGAASLATVFNLHWETAKTKVRRLGSNKLNETFSIVSATLAPGSCALLWLSSDNELYSAQLGQRADIRLAGQLAAARPLIRQPVVRMQLFQGALFFLDSTRRSLMAHRLAEARQQQRQWQLMGGARGPRGPLELAGAHRVLLLEMEPIQDFALLELAGPAHDQWQPDGCGPLAEWLSRKEAGAGGATHTPTALARLHFDELQAERVANPRQARWHTDAPQVEPRAHPAAGQEAAGQVSCLKVGLAEWQWREQVQVALVSCLLVVIAALACANYVLWRAKNKLLAPQQLESGHESAYAHQLVHQLDGRSSKRAPNEKAAAAAASERQLAGLAWSAGAGRKV